MMINNNIKLEQLNTLLKSENVDFLISIHDVNFKTALEGAKNAGISLDETTPTLILKAQNKYIACIICGSTRLSFKKLKKLLNIKDIRMADPEEVFKMTDAPVGEVSLINKHLTTLIDINVLKNEHCYGGCGISNATLKINTGDLIRITNAQILDFADPRS